MNRQIRPNEVNYTDDLKVLIPQLNDRLAVLTEEINRINSLLELQALEVVVEDLDTTVGGQATAINDLTLEVTEIDGDITAVAGRTTSLEATVDDPTTGVTATASALSTLGTEVSSIDGEVTALASNVTTLESTVDLKASTFYQTSAPTATAVGDLWVDTDDGNKVYRWNGTSWIDTNLVDGAISAAVSTEATARATADGFLEGKYTLTATAGNVVTGMNITSASGSGTDVSEVTFQTDKFKIFNGSTGLSPFQISGSDIAFTGNVSFSGVNVSSLNNDAAYTTDQGWTLPSEVAAAVNSNTTTINGGKITTGTITASQIATGTLTADKIQVGTITADRIIDNGVTTGKIAANAVSNLNSSIGTSFNISTGNTYDAISCSASNDSSYKALISASIGIVDVGPTLTDDPTVELWIAAGGGGGGPLSLGAYRKFSWPRGKDHTCNITVPVTSVTTSQYILKVYVFHVNGTSIALQPVISCMEFKR